MANSSVIVIANSSATGGKREMVKCESKRSDHSYNQEIIEVKDPDPMTHFGGTYVVTKRCRDWR